MPLLEIRNLTVEFPSGPHPVRAVDDLSITLDAGQTLCLVGESGCGKTVTALSVARLVPCPPAAYPAGRILLEGRDVLQMNAGDLRRIRGAVVSYVFQEPASALNPVFRVGTQIRESLKLHRPGSATDEEVVRLLRLVGIPAPESRRRDYPFQMSGGMQQRVMIAMALASQPRLLIADEPTTALDVTIQAQILELLRDLQRRFGMALLLITHNLGIVGEMGGQVAVLYAGQVVEFGPAASVLRSPRHPYTRGLLESVPALGAGGARLRAIPGAVPRAGEPLAPCRFAPRCPVRRPDCDTCPPALAEAQPGHWVRCPYGAGPGPDRTPLPS